jgi:hypothetical protein
MIWVLRIVLEAVIFFFLLGIALAIGSGSTGAAETAILVACGAALIYLAVRVRHMGTPPHGA